VDGARGPFLTYLKGSAVDFPEGERIVVCQAHHATLAHEEGHLRDVVVAAEVAVVFHAGSTEATIEIAFIGY